MSFESFGPSSPSWVPRVLPLVKSKIGRHQITFSLNSLPGRLFILLELSIVIVKSIIVMLSLIYISINLCTYSLFIQAIVSNIM